MISRVRARGFAFTRISRIHFTYLPDLNRKFVTPKHTRKNESSEFQVIFEDTVIRLFTSMT